MVESYSVNLRKLVRWAGVLAGLAVAWWVVLPSASPSSPQQRAPIGSQRVVTKSMGAPPRRAVVNFADLARREAAAPRRRPARKVAPFMPTPAKRPPSGATLRPAVSSTTSLGPLAPMPLSPAPSASFEALGDDGTAIPPDTQGAVGPNHLMVTLNSQVRIQNRSGAQQGIVSLESFWSSTGATGVFDPKVAYDHMSSRWVFCAVSNRRSAASSLLIGTSQTNNPTGNWDLYRVDADAGNSYWADYPSVGYNKDWIVVTYNAFANSNDAYVKADIYRFEKADLYAGTAATHVKYGDTQGSTIVPASTFDSSLATMYLTQNLTGNFDFGGGPVGLLEVETITVADGYLFGQAYVSTENIWNDKPPDFADFAPQQGTTAKIQTGDSRLLTLVYRNGSLWAAQTVFLPGNTTPTRSAVQWWQFLPDGDVQQLGRIDDGTGTIFRAFPSLAVNSQNDVLIGYSTFSSNQFASGSYSFRAGSDLPNTMQSEVLLKGGEDTYFKDFGSGKNRWGDFSNTVVDPANDLDMWTIQEYAESHVSDESRWGTWWGKIAIAPVVTIKRRGQLVSD
jgi:hypothetical protein